MKVLEVALSSQQNLAILLFTFLTFACFFVGLTKTANHYHRIVVAPECSSYTKLLAFDSDVKKGHQTFQVQPLGLNCESKAYRGRLWYSLLLKHNSVRSRGSDPT
jgi:hypothetical protein